jgi:hypothetical protein
MHKCISYNKENIIETYFRYVGLYALTTTIHFMMNNDYQQKSEPFTPLRLMRNDRLFRQHNAQAQPR